MCCAIVRDKGGFIQKYVASSKTKRIRKCLLYRPSGQSHKAMHLHLLQISAFSSLFNKMKMLNFFLRVRDKNSVQGIPEVPDRFRAAITRL